MNIADGTNAAQIAHVNAAGSLQVAGTVTTQLATPASYSHSAAFNVDSTRAWVQIATPPTGKAMIIRQVRVDVFADPSPGVGQNIQLYAGTGCSTTIADINPSGIGEVILPFDPGMALPAGAKLSANVFGSVKAEFFGDGYVVPSAQVPASAVNISTTPERPQQSG